MILRRIRLVSLVALSLLLTFLKPFPGSALSLLVALGLQVGLPGYLLARTLGFLRGRHPVEYFVWVLASGLGLTIVLGSLLRAQNTPVPVYLLVLHAVMLGLALLKTTHAKPDWHFERRDIGLYLLVAAACVAMLWVGFQRSRIHFDTEVPTVYTAEVNWLANEADHFSTPDRWVGFTEVTQAGSRVRLDGWTYIEAAWAWASRVPAVELMWHDVTPIFIWVLPLIAFATAHLLSQRKDVAAWSAAALTIFALFTLDPLVYPGNENTLYFGYSTTYLDTVRAVSTVLILPLAVFALLGYLKQPNWRVLLLFFLLGHALAFMRVRQIFVLEVIAFATLVFWWLAAPSRRRTGTALVLLLALLSFAILPFQSYVRPSLQGSIYLSTNTNATNNPASIIAHAGRRERISILEGIEFRILRRVPLLGDTFIIDPSSWFYTPFIAVVLILGLAAGRYWRRNLAAQYIFGTTVVITALVFIPGITQLWVRIFGSAAAVNLLSGLNFALPSGLALGFAAGWLCNRIQLSQRAVSILAGIVSFLILLITFEPVPVLYASPHDQAQAMNSAQQLREIAPFDQQLLTDLPTALDMDTNTRILTLERTGGFLVETFPNVFVVGWESPPIIVAREHRFFDDRSPFIDAKDVQFATNHDFTHIIISADDLSAAQFLLQPERYTRLLNSSGFLLFDFSETGEVTEADRLFSQMNRVYARIFLPRWQDGQFRLSRAADPTPWEAIAAAWRAQPPSDIARYGLAMTYLLMNRDEAALPLWGQLNQANPEIPQIADALAYTRRQNGDEQEAVAPLLQNLDAPQAYTRVLAARTLLSETFFYLLNAGQTDHIVATTRADALTWSQLAEWNQASAVRERAALMIGAGQWDAAAEWLARIPPIETSPDDLITRAAIRLMKTDTDGALALLQPTTDADWLALRRYLHRDNWSNNRAAQTYYLLRGALAEQENRADDAKSAYEEAANLGAAAGNYFLGEHASSTPELLPLTALTRPATGLVMEPQVEDDETSLTVQAAFGNFVPAYMPMTWRVLVISPDASTRYGESEMPLQPMTGALVWASTSVGLPADLPVLTPARVIIQSLYSDTLVYDSVTRDVVLNRPPAARLPDDAEDVAVRFGDHITLAGTAASLTNDTLNVSLYWQTDAGLSENYQVFVHVIASDGSLAAQADAPPVGGRYPTSAWRTNTLIEDAHTLPLNLASGDYDVYVGLYRLDDLTKLPATPNTARFDDDAAPVYHFTIQ